MIRESIERLTLTFPELAPGLLRLEPREEEKLDPPTMATDGRYLYYHPDFVKDLTPLEVDTVVLHEIFHCLFLHLNIESWRDKSLANIAQDFEINGALTEAGFRIPQPGLYDPKYKGLCWQEIYDLLPKSKKFHCCGGLILTKPDGSEWTEEEKNQISREWQAAVADYVELVKQFGTCPAGLEVLIQKKNKLRPALTTILRNFLTKTLNNDHYTYKRLKRRGLALGLILPSTKGEKLGDIAVCLDLSGSMSGNDLNEIWGVISDIAQKKRSKIYLIAGDTEVTFEKELMATEPFPDNISMKGRGGTDFRPLIEAASKHNPRAILFFTDLEGTFGEKPKQPIYWFTKNRAITPPFGGVCLLD